MRINRAAIRYSKASLQNALEKNIADQVEYDFRNIKSTISMSKELKSFLINPILPSKIKLKALIEIFPSINEGTKSILDLISKNRRLDLLEMVAQNFISSYQKVKGKITATVISAIPLNDNLKNEVLQKAKNMTDFQVELKNEIDPSIIGGYILNVADYQIDASIKNQLEKLSTELIKTNILLK
tara:strand:- start:662 stop:1213 length:552 start_codon:yes stop_codon:yes gene_type:complete